MTSAGPNAAVAWETIPPGTTLSGSTNNTIATVTGANALIGEANLTFDGTSTFALTSTTNPQIFRMDLDTGSGRSYHLRNNSSGQFSIYDDDASAVRLMIAAACEVGIGTTGAVAKLHVLNTGDDEVAMFQNSNGSAFSTNRAMVKIDISAAAPDSTAVRFLLCEDNSAARLFIYSDGTVTTAAGNSLASDERLKINIVDASDKLADLMRLRVRNFEWTPEFHPAKVGEKKIGFIAQELETVFPSLTMDADIARDNGIKEELYDSDDDTQYYVDGDDIPDGKQVGDVKTESQIPEGKAIGDVKVAAKDHEPVMRKAIKDAFAPILVKALQEVTTRLEAAEAKITALESA
jgi:hypothetical protein